MVKALLGRKREMSQIFTEDGLALPVTIIEAGPCAVTQVKSAAGKDGYNACQLAFDDKPKNVAKPQRGHFKAVGVSPKRVLREYRLTGDPQMKVGDTVTVETFQVGDRVDITGTTKGRGFQGCIVRHNFKSGPRGHGTKNTREPGSVGQNTSPGRIFPGKRMAGHWGNERATVRNMKVVRVDKERNLLYVHGAVPGHNNADVSIRESIAGSRRLGTNKEAARVR